MGAKELTFKSSMQIDKVIDYIESILESLQNRTLCIQKGDEYITLTPADSLSLEVEAESKSDKEKIAIKLSWSKTEAVKEHELIISSEHPEEKAAADKKAVADNDKQQSESDVKKTKSSSAKK